MPLLQDPSADPYAPQQADQPVSPDAQQQQRPVSFNENALGLVQEFDQFVKNGGDITKLSKPLLDNVRYSVENLPDFENKVDSPSVMYSLFSRGQERGLEQNVAIEAGQKGFGATAADLSGRILGAAPGVALNLGILGGTFLERALNPGAVAIPLSKDLLSTLHGDFTFSNLQNLGARQLTAAVQGVQGNWDNYTSSLPAGIKDVGALYNRAKERASTTDANRAAQLDLQQSEILRSQAARDKQHAQNALDAQTATANVYRSVGLGDFADRLMKAKPDEADKFGWTQLTDPLTYVQLGVEPLAKAGIAQFIKTGIRTERLAEATTALSSVENKLTGLASARTSLNSALVGDVTGRAPTMTETTRAGLQSNVARIDAVTSNMQKDLAAAQAEHAAAVADVNKQLDAAANANPFRQIVGRLTQAVGAGGEMPTKIAAYMDSLPAQVVERFMPSADDATKEAATTMFKRASEGALDMALRLGGIAKFGGVGGLVGGPVGAAIGAVGGGLGPELARAAGKILPNMEQLGEFAKAVKTVGEQYALGQQTLPYWRNVANKLDGVPAWIASKLDNQLVYAVPSAVTGGAMGGAMGGLTGLAMGGGNQQQLQQGLIGGAVIGSAGGGLGQLTRFNSLGTLRQAAIGDRSRFVGSLTTPNKNMFLKLAPEFQLAVSVYGMAHPDAEFRFFADPSKSNGTWTPNNPKSVIGINVLANNPLHAVAAHEVGHHIAAHGLQAQVENNILGDPTSGQRGIMNQLDEHGQPLIETDPATGKASYVQNAEFEKYKGDYNARLLRDNPGAPPATNSDIAQEMFADLHAQYMHNPETLQKTIRGQLPSDLVSENVTSNWLTKMGMGADASTGHPIPTGSMENARALQNIMDTYYKQSQAKRGSVDDPRGDQKIVKVAIGDTIKGTPEFDRLQINLDASGDVRRNPDGTIMTDMAGRPVTKTERQADADAAQMGAAIHNVYHAQPNLEGTPNDNYLKVVTDRDGKQYRRGQRVPEAVFAELEKSNQFNANQLLNWRKADAVMARNDGSMMEAVYNTASKGRGRYVTLPMRERAFVPLWSEVSMNTDQVNIKGYDPEELTINLSKGLKTPMGKDLYNGNLGPALQDAQTYLRNLANDRPGETDIGMQKKTFLNRMMGLSSDANPGAADLAKKAAPIIKSFRLDRLNRIREVVGSDVAPFHEKTYEQIRSFFQPRETPIPEGFDPHQTLREVFGDDAPAFAKALSETDSSKGVAQHWHNALRTYKGAK
jgi:hypothetical protein